MLSRFVSFLELSSSIKEKSEFFFQNIDLVKNMMRPLNFNQMKKIWIKNRQMFFQLIP